MGENTAMTDKKFSQKVKDNIGAARLLANFCNNSLAYFLKIEGQDHNMTLYRYRAGHGFAKICGQLSHTSEEKVKDAIMGDFNNSFEDKEFLRRLALMTPLELTPANLADILIKEINKAYRILPYKISLIAQYDKGLAKTNSTEYIATLQSSDTEAYFFNREIEFTSPEIVMQQILSDNTVGVGDRRFIRCENNFGHALVPVDRIIQISEH